jgi:hypothetical protein
MIWKRGEGRERSVVNRNGLGQRIIKSTRADYRLEIMYET